MNVYRFKVISSLLRSLIFLGGLSAGMLFMFVFLNKEYILIGFLLSVSLVFGVYYLAKAKSIAEVEFRLNDQAMECYWTKQFLLHNKQNVYLEWSTIESYIFEPQRYFDVFKLWTYEGYVLELSHDNDWNQNKFRAFFNAFERRVKKMNTLNADLIFIKKKKNIYEKPLSVVFALLMAVFVLYGLFILLTGSAKNPLGLSYAISIGMFYILQVYNHYKKTKRPH